MRYSEILEACWKGYQKKGMKTMFGKRYPNCVKKTNEEQLDEKCWDGYTQQGMKKKGDRQVPNCVPVSEQQMEEDLKKWFKEKWVRFGPDGKIRGDCARGSSSEGKPKCLPQSKAQALGKKGRASSAAKKRREDPNAERRGAAKNVATKVKEDDLDEGWKQNMAAGILGATMALSPVPARAEIANMSPVQVQQSIKRAELAGKYTEVLIQRAKEDGRPLDTRTMNAIKAKASDMAAIQIQKQAGTQQQTSQSNFPKQGSERTVSPNFDKFESKQELDEKQDACYHKVKSRYKVWPSAYASGALVQCRKKGAANWGNKGSNKK